MFFLQARQGVKDMTIINGLLLLTLILLAGLTYLILDNIRRAEAEAYLSFVRIARQSREDTLIPQDLETQNHQLLMTYDRPEQSGIDQDSLDQEGFFSIRYDRTSAVGQTIDLIHYSPLFMAVDHTNVVSSVLANTIESGSDEPNICSGIDARCA